MGSEAVKVLWVSDRPVPESADTGLDSDVEIDTVSLARAAVVLRQASAVGAVVAIAAPERRFELFSSGADEVLDHGALTRASLDRAVRSAKARASARLGLPRSDTRRAVPEGGPSPSSSAFGGALLAGQPAERHLADTFSYEETLLAPPAGVGMCDVRKVLLEVAELARRDVERVARLSLTVPSHPCVIPLPRPTAIHLVSSLLRNATRTLGPPQREVGAVQLRLDSDSESIVLEVSDDGVDVDVAPVSRRRALDPAPTGEDSGAVARDLAIAASRVRCAGGEMLIDVDPELGTTVRVFFSPCATIPRDDVRRTEPS